MCRYISNDYCCCCLQYTYKYSCDIITYSTRLSSRLHSTYPDSQCHYLISRLFAYISRQHLATALHPIAVRLQFRAFRTGFEWRCSTILPARIVGDRSIGPFVFASIAELCESKPDDILFVCCEFGEKSIVLTRMHGCLMSARVDTVDLGLRPHYALAKYLVTIARMRWICPSVRACSTIDSSFDEQ